MNTSIRWIALALVACSLGACKRGPGDVAAPAPAPKPTSAAPSPQPAPPKAEAPAATAKAPPPIEAVAVTSATLGNAINADKRVTAATDAFRPQDTIYITVETSGAAGANLTARWTFSADGQPTRVNEETQKVPAGPAVTEFHIRKPDGWPVGDYQVAILLNDEVAATRKFSVK